MSKKKPSITIRLSGPEVNAFAIIAKAHKALEDIGQATEAQQVLTALEELTHSPGSVYKDVGSGSHENDSPIQVVAVKKEEKAGLMQQG